MVLFVESWILRIWLGLEKYDSSKHCQVEGLSLAVHLGDGHVVGSITNA